MSMIENLGNMEKLGLRRFIKEEAARWTCPECGAILCVHKEQCIRCGRKRDDPEVRTGYRSIVRK
jgi:rubrerythrin